MGAIITDSVLQAGLNYKTVVFPRIKSLLNKFGDYPTTTDFVLLINLFSLENLIAFKNERKLKCIWHISKYFQEQRIETEQQLAFWMYKKENTQNLLSIYGVGPKTIDYMKKLIGLDSLAIDRHLISFLSLAEIHVRSYHEAKEIYCSASELLELDCRILDGMIWSYMSNAAF